MGPQGISAARRSSSHSCVVRRRNASSRSGSRTAWFFVRFGADTATLGAIFFGANIFGGLSALAAARIAARIGLINTMVWTHVPSNLLLMLVPVMPSLPLAVLVLLARHCISQMDIPTRQSYVMAVVELHRLERRLLRARRIRRASPGDEGEGAADDRSGEHADRDPQELVRM